MVVRRKEAEVWRKPRAGSTQVGRSVNGGGMVDGAPTTDESVGGSQGGWAAAERTQFPTGRGGSARITPPAKKGGWPVSSSPSGRTPTYSFQERIENEEDEIWDQRMNTFFCVIFCFFPLFSLFSPLVYVSTNFKQTQNGTFFKR